MSIGVIIPAAGKGTRMRAQVNKQYLELMGRPVLAHTIDVFFRHPLIDKIVIVTRREEMDYCRSAIIEKYFNSTIEVVAGGKTRRQSVFAGLEAFSSAIDYVIIHDGARPLLEESILNRVLKEVYINKAVTVGVALKDTVKQINEEHFVQNTLMRRDYKAIQTPQAFTYNLIYTAHQDVPDSAEVTDDASLVEYLGEPVKVIEGSYENIKLTTPVDLIFAESILKNR